MEIVLPKVLSGEFKKTTKTLEIAGLEKKLMSFVNSRFYGEDIAEYAIHIICVHPKYDSFFKVNRPTYVINKDVIVEGIPVTIYKRFDVKIKLDFEEFYKSNEEEGFRIIGTAILFTLKNIVYPKTIKDFNKEAFYKDIHAFFCEKEN
ncbi:hypothetical protein [Limibacterium fermenti]|uniref:hypothetical protein n=1 Tax=Limibacterium fermenti TaxID=3229863 RepID=UPI003A6A2F6C